MFAYYALHGMFFLSVPVCGGLKEVAQNLSLLLFLLGISVLNSYLLHTVRHRPGYISKDQLGFREIHQMQQIIEPFPVELQKFSAPEEMNLTERPVILHEDTSASDFQDIPKDQM